MPFSIETFFFIGAVILGGAIAYGMMQSGRRNKANDTVTDQATRAEYKQPETYGAKEEELKSKITRS